jgi:hypothetical protein
MASESCCTTCLCHIAVASYEPACERGANVGSTPGVRRESRSRSVPTFAGVSSTDSSSETDSSGAFRRSGARGCAREH